jgi:hypothetical protein
VAPPAFAPTDAEFQKDAKWLKTYTAGLVNTNRSTQGGKVRSMN